MYLQCKYPCPNPPNTGSGCAFTGDNIIDPRKDPRVEVLAHRSSRCPVPESKVDDIIDTLVIYQGSTNDSDLFATFLLLRERKR